VDELTHRCPGPECDADVSADMLACSRHWYQVPKPLRAAVYRAWDHGLGAGTQAHRNAMRAAVERMQPLARRGRGDPGQ
jgi:hypothetical protein